jgi:5-methylcytosine-specific restriction endonuclease McrA
MNLAEMCREMGNGQLVSRLKDLAQAERKTLTELLAHLMEFDRRRLHAPAGYPSTFAYCTRELGYSGSAAYRRIFAARVASRYPAILPLLETKELHLEAIAIIGPHLTADNFAEVLAQARGRTKQELQFLAAKIRPRPDGAEIIRPAECMLAPAAGTGNFQESSAGINPEERQNIEPLSPGRVEFTFTGSAELLRMIERARELLRHKHPEGKLEDVIGEMAELFLERKDPERRARRAQEAAERAQAPAPPETSEKPEKPSTPDRRIPQWVKNEVWLRDEGRCSYIGQDGQPCRESGGLEFDHVIPWALGGRSDQPANVRLLCRTHNQWTALGHFGPRAMRLDPPAAPSAGPAP